MCAGATLIDGVSQRTTPRQSRVVSQRGASLAGVLLFAK